MRILTASTLGSILVVLAACGVGTQAPPEAGYQRGAVPALEASGVMVFPVQIREGAHPDVDRELQFALSGVGEGVRWIFPEGLREIADRNRASQLQIDGLPVRGFLAGELERIGDPLFGFLFRLSALGDAAYAVLPVLARENNGPDGATVEISAAVIEARTGYVLWYGIVAGVPDAPGSIGGAATAAEALARRVVR